MYIFIMKRNDKEAFFVAVHIGVGYHAEKNWQAKSRTIARACKAAREALRSGSDGLDAVVAAICVLEVWSLCLIEQVLCAL